MLLVTFFFKWKMVFTFMSLRSHLYFLMNSLSHNLTALSADRKTIVTAKLGSAFWAPGIRTPRCFNFFFFFFLLISVFLLFLICIDNKLLMTGLLWPPLCLMTQTSYQNVILRTHIAITVCSSLFPTSPSPFCWEHRRNWALEVSLHYLAFFPPTG